MHHNTDKEGRYHLKFNTYPSQHIDKNAQWTVMFGLCDQGQLIKLLSWHALKPSELYIRLWLSRLTNVDDVL